MVRPIQPFVRLGKESLLPFHRCVHVVEAASAGGRNRAERGGDARGRTLKVIYLTVSAAFFF